MAEFWQWVKEEEHRETGRMRKRLEEVAAKGGWVARRKWKRKRKEVDEGWQRRQRGCWWVCVHTLGIEVRDGTGVDEQEKGRRGWVIYFPPARHNLSRGFSREHAESTAIEEELGRREERGK